MTWFDSLTRAWKGGASQRVPLTPFAFDRWANAIAIRGAHADFSYDRAIREGFLVNPIAQRAVRIVTEAIGQTPLHANNARLLKLVGPNSAGQSALEVIAAHFLLHGNAYVQVVKDAGGQPLELFPLRPDRVTVLPGQDGWPSGYEYRLAGKTTTLAHEDASGWPNLIHIAALNPLDDHYGSGALHAAWQAIAIHNAASAWNRSLLENAARPSGALVHEGPDGMPLTGEQFDRLARELHDAYSGPGSAGRPLLLDGGLKWQSLALSPTDMDFAALKSAAARDIALAFGVPPMLLGLPGDNTYANYREANRALWRLTLLPLAGRMLEALQNGLQAWFPGATITVDLDRVPALSEERERLWQQVSQAGFLSDLEKRTLLGLEAEPHSLPATQDTPR